MKRNTKKSQIKIPSRAAKILRSERGTVARLAENLNVSRSTITRVVNGERNTPKVRRAVVAELYRLARKYDTASLLVSLEG